MELLTTTLYQAYALFYMMPEGMPPDPALPCGLLFSTLESTTGQHPAGEHPASSVCRQEAPPCWADSPILCVPRERRGPGGRGEAEQLVQVPPGVRGGVPANPADPGPPHQPGIPQGRAAAVDCHVSVTPSPPPRALPDTTRSLCQGSSTKQSPDNPQSKATSCQAAPSAGSSLSAPSPLQLKSPKQHSTALITRLWHSDAVSHAG